MIQIKSMLTGKVIIEVKCLRYADLRGLGFRYADLRGANFQGANFQGANLQGANFQGAYLRGADFTDAYLRGANFTDTNLWRVIGNKREIKSLQIEGYDMAYTYDRLQIGCENHSIEEWFDFDIDTISEMDDEAWEWWTNWKGFIFDLILKSPAKSCDTTKR